ncbi:hypothetical protein NC653_041022 [Populus alba x Populus x berolinensis]|uniref:Uncharacterized protein n=1 Tax=Populus alba x Populus x berolinensis TaxID=444605 RepID=A0AAD6L8I3_9ROSI|nr:hypothetical protein NC653_041022 [Populus alba x Populus x berolinensis]
MVTLVNISANLCQWQHMHIVQSRTPEQRPSLAASPPWPPSCSLFPDLSLQEPQPCQSLRMIDGLLRRCREMKPVVVSLFNKQERDTFPSGKAVFGHMMRRHPQQRVFSTDLRRKKKKKVSSRVYRDRLAAKNPVPPLNPETETLPERHKDPAGVTIYMNT